MGEQRINLTKRLLAWAWRRIEPIVSLLSKAAVKKVAKKYFIIVGISYLIIWSWIFLKATIEYKSALTDSALILKIISLVVLCIRMFLGVKNLLRLLTTQQCRLEFGESRLLFTEAIRWLAVFVILVLIGELLSGNYITELLVHNSYFPFPSSFYAEVALLLLALSPIGCVAYVNLTSWVGNWEIPDEIKMYGKNNFLHAELPCLVASSVLIILVSGERAIVHSNFDNEAVLFLHGALAFLIFSVALTQDIIHVILESPANNSK